MPETCTAIVSPLDTDLHLARQQSQVPTTTPAQRALLTADHRCFDFLSFQVEGKETTLFPHQHWLSWWGNAAHIASVFCWQGIAGNLPGQQNIMITAGDDLSTMNLPIRASNLGQTLLNWMNFNPCMVQKTGQEKGGKVRELLAHLVRYYKVRRTK